MLRQIGVTGGIGSGKSLICKMFNILGIPSYDADSRAKRLMTTDGILVDAIKKEFGTLSYYTDGNLNREFIGSIVFDNAEKLKTLNSLVHPRVAEDYQGWIKDQAEKPYVIREAALLFESSAADLQDQVIVVSAPESLRIARVLKRDPQRTENEVRNIIKNQMSEDEKRERADFIIVNDDTQLVIPQVLKLHRLCLGKEVK
jgi:dephospho-CoA kinase